MNAGEVVANGADALLPLLAPIGGRVGSLAVRREAQVPIGDPDEDEGPGGDEDDDDEDDEDDDDDDEEPWQVSPRSR